MSWIDDHYDEIIMEQYAWRDEVEEYVAASSDQELMKATGEVLRALPEYLPEDDKGVVKARSILQKGIIYQKLTEKQRYALGDFILSYH
ncbi:hypothetical protein P59_041 [Bacillus phage P59]|nr:hypothetical protein P59_041 [Bacillus phage P59]